MIKQFVIIDNGEDHSPWWTEDFASKLAKCWKSVGGMTMMVDKCNAGHWHFICCPSLREVVGGPKDGEQIYPRFQLSIGRFVRAFDENPKVFFDSSAEDALPFVTFVGKVNGEDVEVAVISGPVQGQPAIELGHTQGPKKGQVESRLPRQEDGDVASGE